MGDDKSVMYGGIGVGAAALGICVGIGSCFSFIGNTDAEVMRARAEVRALKETPVIYQKDLDSNGLVETFYEIDDVKYFSTVNGRIVEDMLGDSLASR